MVVTVWGVMLCLAFDLIWPWCALQDMMQRLRVSVLYHILSGSWRSWKQSENLEVQSSGQVHILRGAENPGTFFPRLAARTLILRLLNAFDKNPNLVARYISSEALETLARAFQACGEILEQYFECWHEELAHAALPSKEREEREGERLEGIARLEKGVLNKRIALPLGGYLLYLGTHDFS